MTLSCPLNLTVAMRYMPLAPVLTELFGNVSKSLGLQGKDWWCAQLWAKPSPLLALINRENTGNFSDSLCTHSQTVGKPAHLCSIGRIFPNIRTENIGFVFRRDLGIALGGFAANCSHIACRARRVGPCSVWLNTFGARLK